MENPSSSSMRTLCPNLDKEDGLETVLEVPIPEEAFNRMAGNSATLRWQSMRNLMRNCAATVNAASNNHQFMLLLKLVCSPSIPCHALSGQTLTTPVNKGTIEASTAKYIVQQYLASTGGLSALNAINSMYAVGQVKLVVESDVEKAIRSEAGGFVLWQMNPDLWHLELIVSGYKIIAGCDGKIAWSQSSLNLHASRGSPRLLRRLFQGLDPRSTANLFLNTVCIGEKVIENEECFILKRETSPDMLKAHSTPNIEIVHHTMWGYFSHRTGLLIQFEDSKLIRMKGNSRDGSDSVFYETSMESVLEDYRHVDGINIAHGGRTSATLFRYGETFGRKWKLMETWRIEEIDFNIDGLSGDYFLPPADSNKEAEHEHAM